MQGITHINQREAEAIRAELLAAVGTENVPNQWAIFMRTVRHHMPDVLARGRPTREAIQRSPIGQLGFSSWRDMLDAPTAEGGLGLGWSKWREWSRAWKVIADLDGLADAPITAAEVNRVAQQAKEAGEEVPATWEAWQDFRERYATAKAERRAQSVAALEQRVSELEKELATATAATHQYQAEVANLRAARDEATAKLRDADRRTGELEADQRRTVHELDQLRTTAEKDQKRLQQLQRENQKLQQELAEYRDRTLLARLWAVFSP